MISVPGDSEDVTANDPQPTILLVDDHQHFLNLIATMLHKSGYRVITACDGTEALRKASEFEGPIQVLVADVQIPGMSGIELAIQIRRQRAETRILLISGHDWRLLAQKYDWPFLRKPFPFQTLNESIRKLLSERRPLAATDPTDMTRGFLGQHAGDE